MAENVITGLIPDIYEALDITSRELVGLVPAVTMNASAERAALNENIRVSIEPTANVSDITPSMTLTEPTGQTTGFTDIVITKERAAEFGFIGNQQMALQNGVGYQNSRAGKIAQALRSLTNEFETDLAALHTTFSRAYGTAGTTPFSTANDYTEASNALKILKDNGSPQSDNHMVINTTAGANFIGKQSAVNSAGTDSMLRQGVLLDLVGMPLRESAQINTTTAGTGTSYTSDTTGYAIGSTSITLITGSGTVLAGDTVTWAGDNNKYVVATGVTAPGTIVLAAPGLRVAIPASTVAMTVGSASARNMCFNRSALVLATRVPAMPEEGDQASDGIIITDPHSGLTFEFLMYKGRRKVRYEVGAAWGVKNIKPEHTALLLG